MHSSTNHNQKQQLNPLKQRNEVMGTKTSSRWIALGMAVATMFVVQSCGANPEQQQASGLFAIDAPAQGQTISNEEALTQLANYCGESQLAEYMDRIAKRVDFQASYVQMFSGSGYSYSLAKKTGLSGKEGYYRSDRGQMFSRNGMGMNPPSQDYRHEDGIRAECIATADALNGSNAYEQVEAVSGASIDGTVAHGKVSADDCLSIQMLSRKFGMKHTVTFCPDAFFQDATSSGSGADSRAQLVIHRG